METPLNAIESLIEPIESYVKTTYELSKLKLLEKSTIVATSLIAKLIVIMIISLFALILSIAIAFWLGDLLGKPYYGFFIVAGFDLVAAITSYFFLYKWIKKPVSNSLIKQVLK